MIETSSIEKVLQEQKVDPKLGLSHAEWEKRLQQMGPNELAGKKENIWMRLLIFFWGPIPWMIEVAALLSLYLRRFPDFILIILLLFINASLGFFQEYKAANAIEALKKKLALKARVKREGNWLEVEASKLVPGDIVSVKLGNIIPADLKLFAGEYLTVDQSALTGESLPVEKKVGDDAFSGTIAKMGEMTGVVVATGFRTFFGKTAKLITEAKSISHFQKAVLKIGHMLIISTLLIAATILLVDLFRLRFNFHSHQELGQIAIFLLVIVIAGIPVALPAVLSMTMAVGANKMAKLKAIVSKLIAIEELAGMDILCSDKTGTLTKNELVVGDLQPFAAKSVEELILYAALASEEGNDPIDNAIFSRLSNKELLKEYHSEKFVPFDPIKKRTEAHIRTEKGESFLVCKGAPQIILTLCERAKTDVDKVNDSVDRLAGHGFRTLAVAKQVADAKWEFLGLIPLFDPPREDTKETIAAIKEIGIRVKMVTGDHTAIAREIASSLDLGTNITKASVLDSPTTEENSKIWEQSDGFSEVFPQHKFEIVKRFQKDRHILGMTGDGVNDAPALKQADIGIAVANATDAARSAADLILTESGLMVIKQAIDEARRIFGRMKSYAIYRISETYRLLLFLLLSMMFFDSHPLTAVMIIAIALLNDIPIMMIAYDRMRTEKKPVSWDMTEVFTIAVGLAVVGVLSTFGLYWIGESYWQFSAEKGRTLAFMAILCGGNLTIYLTRNHRFILDRPLPEWRFFLATLFSQIVGTCLAVYGLGTEDFVGIGWYYVGLSWLYIAIWFGICFLTKIALYRLLLVGSRRHRNFVETTSAKLHSSHF